MNVKIFKPSASAMSSGLGKTKKWVLEYEPASKRSPEPLMGWSQSNDTLNQVRLKFDTSEDAVAYAQNQGWGYTVASEKKKKSRPRSYMDNFKYVPPKEEGA